MSEKKVDMLGKPPAPRSRGSVPLATRPMLARLPSGAYAKLGHTTDEVKERLDNYYLVVARIDGKQVIGEVWSDTDERVYPLASQPEVWRGARFRPL